MLAGSHITKLSQDVVNKIAAGEVITRPAAALKEMIENSLDAGSTSVAVMVKGGGLALLQIQDNGHGIHKEDFPLLCERFATSKLSSFEDLINMRTYGFRGEALASISFVARVKVVSMVPGAPCAYTASFVDGKMVGEPKPTAGVKGTLISVEDMFHNVPARKAAFKNASEEYSRILQVVQNYALFSGHRGVAFSCKKQGEGMPDVNIPARTSMVDSICAVYGASIKRELMPLEVTWGGGGGGGGSSSSAGDALHFSARGWVSSANYSMKRGVFTLFINGRLVDCGPLRRAMEALYTDLLPKGSHPFAFLALDMPPNHVDVNVHPTKREVGFLHQDELVEAIVSALSEKLAGAQSSRVFPTHAVLPLPSLSLPGSHGSAATEALGLTPIDRGAAHAHTAHHGRDDSLAVPADGEQPAAAYKKVQLSLDAFAAPGSALEVDAADQRVAGKVRQGGSSAAPSHAPAPYVPHKLVRVHAGSHGTMEKFLVHKGGAGGGGGGGGGEEEPDEDVILVDAAGQGGGGGGGSSGGGYGSGQGGVTAMGNRKSKRSRVSDLPVMLTSVTRLLSQARADYHAGLAAALRRHVLVGVVDRHTTLIQYNTKLLLVNHTQLGRELFYQRALHLFGNVASFAVAPPPDVGELALLALHANGIGTDEGGGGASDSSAMAVEEGEGGQDRPALARAVVDLLLSKASMLEEYFGIGIRADARGEGDPHCRPVRLTHLPRLVDGHTPVLDYTPDFLLQLAWDVDWSQEEPCFQGVCQALGAFYAHPPPLPDPIRRAVTGQIASQLGGSGGEAGGGGGGGSSGSGPPSRRGGEDARVASDGEVEAYRSSPESVYWRTAHLLLPAVRATASEDAAEASDGFMPPRKLAREHAVVQVACTEQLYRIFERC